MRLHWRLMLSYMVLLVVVLGVTAASALAILQTRPAPAEPVYIGLLETAAQLQDVAPARRGLRPLQTLAAVEEALDVRGVRLLQLDERRDVVLADSIGLIAQGDTLAVREDSATLNRLLRQRREIERVTTSLGRFNDTEGEWLYVRLGFALPRLGVERGYLLAAPAPTITLAQSLEAFTGTLGPLLAQAIALGVLFSLALALLISRSLAHSLRAVADAAHALARGDLGRRAQVRGARETRALADAFNTMAAQVQATQQAQQDFLANVTHDLKTPLTSIQGYSQAIMDGAAHDPVAAARVIHAEAERMARLVAQITDLARLEAGGWDFKPAPLDLGTLVTGMAERLAPVAAAQSVALHVDAATPGPSLRVLGDGDRLAQVVANLVDNAIAHTPRGGRVWLGAQALPGGVALMVRDDGVGIAQEDLPRVFERFYQADRARGPQRGTGLGLAIVAQIVALHGGHVTAVSDGLGHGSTFTAWLPAAPPLDAKPARSPAQSRAKPQPGRAR